MTIYWPHQFPFNDVIDLGVRRRVSMLTVLYKEPTKYNPSDPAYETALALVGLKYATRDNNGNVFTITEDGKVYCRARLEQSTLVRRAAIAKELYETDKLLSRLASGDNIFTQED